MVVVTVQGAPASCNSLTVASILPGNSSIFAVSLQTPAPFSGATYFTLVFESLTWETP